MRTLVTGATIWNGLGAGASRGDVLIEDNRISAVSAAAGQIPSAGCDVIDGFGKFLMPGMTEGHTHLSFENLTTTEDLIRPTPEEQVFTAARSAKALLDAGFTSAYGASEAKLRLGVAVRNEVNAGRLPGPRIRAAGLEISVTGAMGDESKEHDPRIGPSTIVDGIEQMRRAVRFHCREGCDNIKLDVSGDPFYPNTPGHTTPMTFEEIKVAVDTAHDYGRKVNAHTRSIEGSKRCIRAGVDVLFHVEYSDEELLDLMEEAKDRIFVAPTVGLFAQIMNGDAAAFGFTPQVGGKMNIPDLIENSIKTHTELRKRGVRHLIGGDYGFPWSVQGTQARDLKFFIEFYGYSPEQAMICATFNGGRLMRDEGDLGSIVEGQLADLLLVDGNPLEEVGVMLDSSRLLVIMKDGKLHKCDVHPVERRVAA